jgi:transposase
MPPVDRNNPKRAKSSSSAYSVMEFHREFPDDAACLDYLWRQHYSQDGSHAHCPKCDKERKFHRVKDRPAYDCDSCGYHLHPTAGTIFHKSSSSLVLWFYATYLMSETRCGVSAKHLERELGVTYKTAWRMANRIRNQLMKDDDDAPLSGCVEVDETSIEGKPKKRLPKQGGAAAQRRERDRGTVIAAVERGGRIKATAIASRRGAPLRDKVIEWVDPAAILYTDQWPAYNFASRHFAGHKRINHAVTYVEGTTHTNTVEGFFGNLKTGIRGNYKKVSRRWLQGYLNEFTFRYNHREDSAPIFKTLLAATSRVAV